MIEVRAEDDSGNLSASSLSITVSFPYADTQAPVWNSCSGTVSNAGLTSATFTWSGSASDDVGIDYYRVGFNWAGDGTESINPQQMSGSGSVTLQYYWLQISGSVFVTAVDTFGNETDGCFTGLTLYDASTPSFNSSGFSVSFGPIRNDGTIYSDLVSYIDITAPVVENTRRYSDPNGGYEIELDGYDVQWGTISGGETKRFSGSRLESWYGNNEWTSGSTRTFNFCVEYHTSVLSTSKSEVCYSKQVTVP